VRAKSPQEKEIDEKIDAIQEKNMEAFLREKNSST
jgi:hypothetical protein